jgi:hypothetical protein
MSAERRLREKESKLNLNEREREISLKLIFAGKNKSIRKSLLYIFEIDACFNSKSHIQAYICIDACSLLGDEAKL